MVPENELYRINLCIPSGECDRGAEPDADFIETCFVKIHQSWEDALFSSLPESSLLRYFHLQLRHVSAYADTCLLLPWGSYRKELTGRIVSLIELLAADYESWFNWDQVAPSTYHQKWTQIFSVKMDQLITHLNAGRVNPELKHCLLNWLSEISVLSADDRYTFRAFRYMGELINQLRQVDYLVTDVEDQIVAILSQLNFNHLSFFAYYQSFIKGKLSGMCAANQLDYLNHQKAGILACAVKTDAVYDPSWPSLKCMMGDWLSEEIYLAEMDIKKETGNQGTLAVPKLPLELSVAHLACLIRLLFEEGIIATKNLKTVFKCFAGHYQTKRQSAISPGSLSKEFYSIDQHTAARVQDMLQKMVLRINRNFFPVMVAISITAHACQGMH